MGWESSDVFQVVIVRGNQGGVFVYDSSGNLIDSIALQGSTDPQTHSNDPGIVNRSLAPVGGFFTEVQVNNGLINFASSLTRAGPYSSIGTIGLGAVSGSAGTVISVTATGSLIISSSPGTGGIVFLAPSGDSTGATDYATINAVLAAGITPVLLPGTFDVNQPVVMTDGTELEGCGWSTILQMANGKNLNHLIDASGTTRCSIRNLKLDGNKANQTGGGTSLISGDNSTDLVVSKVWATNSYQQGIYFGGAVNALVEGCYSTGNGVTIGFGFGLNNNSAKCRHVGCYSTGNKEGGYSLFGSTALNAASQCTITGCTADSEVLGFNAFNAQDCAITGNTATGCTTSGIQVEHAAANVTVTGNTVTGAGGTNGINMVQTGNGCVASGNTVTGAGIGINVDNAPDIACTGNNCYNNLNTGIYLGHNTGVTNFNCTGNTCQSNGQAGIHVGSTTTGGVIAGNVCNSNGGGGSNAGISLDGTITYVTVSGNTCMNNGQYGIREIQGAVDHIIYVANVCHGNGLTNLQQTGMNDIVANNITV